jgi:DNA-binding LacI/PurR family transcriptional regulator
MNEKDIKRPTTLRDIASKAKVHPSTVSRAMRNDPHISEAIRKNIQDIAKQMGYRPNPFVSAFTAQVRSYRGAPHGVTIVMLDHSGKHLNDNLWQGIYIKGIRSRADQLGYKTEIISFSKLNYSTARLNKILRGRGIRGMIILPVPKRANLSSLNCEHLALATISYSVKHLSINKTSLDYYQCMMLVLDNLVKKGYKRIGFSIAQSDLQRFGERLFGGFVGWQQTIPANKRIPVHINNKIGTKDETAKTRSSGRKDYENWLTKYNPEVIIGSSSRFHQWLLELGFNIPDDIGFVSVGNISETPGVSGVDQKHLEMGRTTTDLIIDQFHSNEYGPPNPEKTVMVEGGWIEGNTLKQLR